MAKRHGVNSVNLYPGITDRRCYALVIDGMVIVHAMHPDYGAIGTAASLKEFPKTARQGGWEPVNV